MFTNELRIGNIIEFCNFIQPKRFVTVDARFFCSMAAGRSIKPDEEINNYYSPVFLTPEILNKCGFEFITDWTVKGNDGVSYRKDLGWLKLEVGMMSTYIVTLVDKNGFSTGVNIEYLHQLQNIYFTLTQTELQINL